MNSFVTICDSSFVVRSTFNLAFLLDRNGERGEKKLVLGRNHPFLQWYG